ncbi:MFS transporter [Dactylosporangium sp. NPDC051541]|uniref:MFS transporter n=1 Tax=Dactylosporangium sp. NPDC051541 TaxID=3363977 RepID=UPI0037BE0BCF
MSGVRLLLAAVLARTADSSAGVVLILASLHRFGGPAQGSLVLAVVLVPHLLAGPLVGLVTDRARSPRLVHAAFVAGFGLALGGILALLGHAAPPLVWGLALVAGGCGSMIFGGLSGRLDDVVAAEHRTRFRGLDAATYNVADIFGPAAGAALVVTVGVPVAAAVITATCLCAAVLLLTVHPLPAPAEPGTPPERVAAGAEQRESRSVEVVAGAEPEERPVDIAAGAGVKTRPVDVELEERSVDAAAEVEPEVRSVSVATGAAGEPRGSFGQDLRAGFRAIVVSRPLLAVTVATCLATFGNGMLPSIAVLLGEAHGHPAGGGLLVTAIGVGALAGSLAMARWPLPVRPHKVVFGCLVVIGVGLSAVPLLQHWALVVALFAVVGVFDGPLFTSVLQVRAEEAPARVRTQVFTLGAGVKLTAAAAGAAVAAGVVGWPLGVIVLGLAGTQLVAAAAGVLLARD